jgi:hypothetical protein
MTSNISQKASRMESDWKKFRALIPILRDRYLAERNAYIVEKLTDPQKTDTERFWDAAEAVQEEAKTLRRCLDDLSRSNMWLTLLLMRRVGTLRKEDLVGFSEELQKQVFDPSLERKPTDTHGKPASDLRDSAKHIAK